jgi:maltose alpha-D-glucosyltransferase/alpha-amylase
MFLRNHDELTLEMVTDEERDYMRKYYAADPKARINLGIRRRLAPLLENDRRRIELMNILLFSLPGTPVLYYGDEIGMGDNYYLGDRDGVRTPMQWNANQNAGFSEANPQSLYLPVIIDPEYDYKYINVERQQRNTNSLLWWMKRTMATRQNYKEVFGRGEIEFLAPENSKVLAFLRTYQNQTILVVANLSRFVEGVYLDLSPYEGFSPVEIFGESTFQTIGKTPYFLSIAPHGYYWFLLKPVEILTITDEMLKSPEITAVSFEALLQQKTLTNDVLPKYFKRTKWFGNKDRNIESVILKEQIQLSDDYAILLVETIFRTGIPELYQIPVTFKILGIEEDIWRKEEVLGIGRIGEQTGILLDAFHDEKFRLSILNESYSLLSNPYLVVAFPKNLLVSDSIIRRATEQYVSIAYKEGYFVKFYRRLDSQPNPDYELNYWLTHKKVFNGTPALIGSLMFQKPNWNTSLAVIQPLIHHQGYGLDYVMNNMKRLVENVLVNKDKLIFAPSNIQKFDTLAFDHLPEALKSVMDYSFVVKIQQLAARTAQMHLALINLGESADPSFEPELYSLHYQRSLYSALKSLVRTSISALQAAMPNFDDRQQSLAKYIIGSEKKMLTYFSRIYIHKFDASKIRIHGNFHLQQVMMVGDDIMIDDFDSTPDRAFSERKLRKSPLVDVATMLRSIHYAVAMTEVQHADNAAISTLLPIWYETICSFFLQTYRKDINAAQIPEFIPDHEDDFRIMVEVFLLERALKELMYELSYRPENVTIPMKGILNLLGIG